MSVSFDQLRDVFLGAIDQPPDRWDDYLDGACGSDADLRRQAAELLAAHRDDRGLLDQIDRGPESAPPGPPSPEPGTTIGPYTLLEAIGEGGMGTVYMAEQTEPVRRRVALKVIKPGMDSKQVITRFEAERQALALMDHPNIAKVHDAGMTPSGRPYFVMELVRGLPITDYCDEQRLTIPERLELFVLVCRAVQHAHQKGIIHRDIKPSNVLVTVIDGVAVPKLIDFGVAKATGQALTESTLCTGCHQFVGTPLYTSPEQAELSGVDLDTRSDVYSLGVLLYELLTGTTPFDSEKLRNAAFDEMRRIIREEAPPRPSARLGTPGENLTRVSARRRADPKRLGASLRGELDWVVMKALEKDRGRRYETANGFAADVMRYLTDRPVEACPPALFYELTKFTRRNRLVIIPVVACGLLTVVGLSLAIAVVARERDEARAQRDRADDRFRVAYSALYRLRLTAMGLRLAAGPERTTRLQQTLTEESDRYLRRLVENSQDDPGIAFEVAQSHFYLALIAGRGGWDDFNRQLAAALGHFGRLAQRRPNDPRALGSMAQILLFMGHAQRRIQGFDPAQVEDLFRRSLELFERVAWTTPNRVDDWYLVSNHTEWGYSDFLRSMGRLDEARALDRRILALFERPEFDLGAFEKYAGARARGEGFDGFLALSRLLVRCDQPLKAIPILERARPHLVSDKDYEYYVMVLTELVSELLADPDPAVRARAVPLARGGVEVTCRTDAKSWLLLGLASERNGDLAAADEAFKKGVELHDDQPGSTLNKFAWSLVSDSRFWSVSPAWAIRTADRAVQIAPTSPAFRKTQGLANYRAGHWGESARALQRAIELHDAASKTPTEDADLLYSLAMALARRGDLAAAREAYDRAVQAWPVHHFRAEAAAVLGLDRTRNNAEAPQPPRDAGKVK